MPSNDPDPDSRQDLRRRLRRRRRALAVASPQAGEAAASILPLDSLPPVRTFSAYSPAGSEIDPGPLSARLKAVIDEDSEIYLVVRRVIIATLKGQPQPLVIESARTAISPTHQPSFSEIFDGLRTAK